MSAAAINLILLTATAFGTSLLASRFALQQFTPLGFVSLRLILAGLGFLLLYIAGYSPWPRERHFWKHVLVVGLIGTAVPMVSFVSALLYLSSGLTSIFSASGPALTVLFAHFVLVDEQLNGRKGIGIFLALTGAVLLVILGESGLPAVQGAGWPGYFLVSLALVCVSSNTVYIRKFLREYPSFQVTSVQVIVGALTLLPLAGLTGRLSLANVDIWGYSALIYGSLIGTLTAFWLYIRLVQEHGATAAALTNYVIPIVATTGGVLFLNETITWGMAVGVALILGGIAVLNRSQMVRPVG